MGFNPFSYASLIIPSKKRGAVATTPHQMTTPAHHVLSRRPANPVPRRPRQDKYRHALLCALVRRRRRGGAGQMQLRQQGQHRHETGDAQDVHGRQRLALDVDALCSRRQRWP